MTDSRKSDPTSLDDMQRLQDLILGEEKDRLHKLDRRVRDLEMRTTDVAEVLPAAMNRVAGDPANRPEFEKPVVNTIRTAIKRDTQSFAEALFPVLGPAIRRAVADALKSMVQRINVALENSFTVKGLRWRLESARTGVPFAQIVLRHTMLYAIQEAFLIQRGSGLVLASVHRDESLALDEDAVASMLTAIQSFIQDSFGVTSDEPLRSAELGEQTMWVINGPDAVLACVITGTPPRTVRDELMDLLETLHARFGSEFRDRPEVLTGNEGLQALMGEALREEADETLKSSTSFKYRVFWLVAGLALLAFVIFRSVDHYRERQFSQQVSELFRSQPGYVITDSEMAGGVLRLYGLQDPVATPVSELLAANHIPAKSLSMQFNPYQSLEPAMVEARLRRQLSLDDGVNLAMQGDELVVSGAPDSAQLVRLEQLPATHAVIRQVNLDAIRYPAAEAAARIRTALEAPGTVNFNPDGSSLALSGMATAAWLTEARNAAVNTLGWSLNFAPLERDMTVHFNALKERMEGMVFQFIDGARLTNESEAALDPAGRQLVELQALAGALGLPLNITLEGLGDGIDTYEKNLAVARMRTDRVLNELQARGVEPGAIRHTMGEWEQGGLDRQRRRVTLRVQQGGSQ